MRNTDANQIWSVVIIFIQTSFFVIFIWEPLKRRVIGQEEVRATDL